MFKQVPGSQDDGATVVDMTQTAKGGDGKQKSGRRIRWHEGDKFLDEFDDSHLWSHGKFFFGRRKLRGGIQEGEPK